MKSGALHARATNLLWTILIAILALGHVTAARNTLVIVVIISCLISFRRADWQALPARWWLLSILVWSALSITWSSEPATSLGKFRSDLLLPLLAFAALNHWVRAGNDASFVMRGVFTGLALLALLSILELLPMTRMDALIAEAHFESLARELPIWYPGVGDASTFALFCAPPLLYWLTRHDRPRPWELALWGAVIVLIITVSANRMTLVVLPLAVAIASAVSRRIPVAANAQASRRRPWLVAAAALGAAVLVALAAEVVSRERILQTRVAPPPFGGAAIALMKSDPRPQMWERYMERGMEHPWIGTGFGRTVPAATYHLQDDPLLTSAGANLLQHAHNLFINIWLQVGAIGLVLWLGALSALVASALKTQRSRARSDRIAGAIVALIAAMILRDMTDDFMVYGTALAFWILLGTLFGLFEDVRAETPPQNR